MITYGAAVQLVWFSLQPATLHVDEINQWLMAHNRITANHQQWG